jgi:hypothetical protein
VQHAIDQREAERYERVNGADGQPVEADRREEDRIEQ